LTKARLIFVAVMLLLFAQVLLAALAAAPTGYFDGD
jgi:hypothetical protein